MVKQPVVLAILDGFGISFEKRGNPMAVAKMLNLREIGEYYPGTTLRASGIEVGLSWGEMGSSEVGHANIGSGLVVYQNLERFNIAIKNGEFYDLPAWKRVVHHAEENKSAIHLMGLLSNGGVHAHIDHLFAILRSIKFLKFRGPVFIHVFTDGQDVAPESALKFLDLLESEISREKTGIIASVCGRYYAMDRGENWDRIEQTYRLLTEAVGHTAINATDAIVQSYEKNIKDEYVEPTIVLAPSGEPFGVVKGNDAVIFFNFRADRARQLTRAFTDPNFNKFPRVKLGNLLFVSLTQYGTGYPMESAFPPEYISTPLAKVISDAGKKQLHMAEKEKYAHITYFFNGGVEKEFPGEDRIIIPSKTVPNYDDAPEMSAVEITDRLIVELEKGVYDFAAVNFANGDIVGHTGNFEASVRALEILDNCVGRIKNKLLELGGILVITADHGNVEELVNLVTGEVDKEHSTNPVPFWIVAPDNRRKVQSLKPVPAAPQGILADVAPTVLALMSIPQPMEMSGTSLLEVLTECPMTR